MGRAAGEQHGVVQPIPSPIEISLADLLFPPSPPLVASTSTPSASLASSPTIVENSGDDLPSPVQFRSLSSRIPLSTTTTKSRETRLVPETIVDSSEDDKEERERIKSLKSQRRKGKGRPSQTIYILDDSEDDRVTSAAPKPSTSKSNGRARRRITISIDVESSSSESDTALALIPSRRPHRTLQPTTPASTRIPKSKPIPTQTEECVCVGDSEEEREGVEREAVVSLPTETTTGGTPQPKENDCSDPFATEYDPYAGVLTYEPSHRNPVRFRKSLLDCLNVPITPSRADKPVKKIKPRVEIDLTLSSSDESEFVRAVCPQHRRINADDICADSSNKAPDSTKRIAAPSSRETTRKTTTRHTGKGSTENDIDSKASRQGFSHSGTKKCSRDRLDPTTRQGSIQEAMERPTLSRRRGGGEWRRFTERYCDQLEQNAENDRWHRIMEEVSHYSRTRSKC